MTYSIPLLPGVYDIRLHFAEYYFGVFRTGGRVFDVKLEGSVVFPGVDIWDEVGNHTALIKSVTSFAITDGALDISFGRNKENPKVSSLVASLVQYGKRACWH